MTYTYCSFVMFLRALAVRNIPNVRRSVYCSLLCSVRFLSQMEGSLVVGCSHRRVSLYHKVQKQIHLINSCVVLTILACLLI